MLNDAMRVDFNIDESDEGAVTKAPMLPGMAPPKYIAARDEEGNMVPVKYIRSVRPERVRAIAERYELAGRIEARAQDLENKETFLAPYTPDDSTTVEEALKRPKEEAPPPEKRPEALLAGSTEDQPTAE